MTTEGMKVVMSVMKRVKVWWNGRESHLTALSLQQDFLLRTDYEWWEQWEWDGHGTELLSLPKAFPILCSLGENIYGDVDDRLESDMHGRKLCSVK
jgi:hypothetical protein